MVVLEQKNGCILLENKKINGNVGLVFCSDKCR